MTSVTINKVGTDSVELELMQTGSYTTSVDLKDNLLDNALNYHFCVTELNVPLQQSPMFPITEDKILFEVMRRNVGVGIQADGSSLTEATTVAIANASQILDLFNANVTAGLVTVAGITLIFQQLNLASALVNNDFTVNFNEAIVIARKEYERLVYVLNTVSNLPNGKGTYTVSPNHPMYDTGDFCKDLSRWVRQFNYETSALGIDGTIHDGGNGLVARDVAGADLPYEFLRLSLTCDGSLEIIGFPIFWQNFMIRFTSYGTALLGVNRSMLERNLLAFTRVGAETLPFSDLRAPILDAGGLLIVSGVQREILVDTVSPIFETSDQRIKISVESHLPITSSKQVIDEKETVNREIAEVFFENEIETETKYDNSGNYAGIALKTKLYSGQTAMIRRSDRHQNWIRLTTAFELKFFKFFLHIHYRVWNEVSETWSIQRQKMNVPSDAYWIMNIRFVSNI